MPNNLDLLMAALDGDTPGEAAGNDTVTTVINIDSSSNTAKSNPKVAGVKRKASSNSSNDPSNTSSNTLPPSLASILSTSSDNIPNNVQEDMPLQLPPTILAEDSGVIRCICIFDDDDGFSIQCEKCFAWQHGLCVNVTPDAVPESYICPLCAASASAASTASPRKRASRASSSLQSHTSSLPSQAGTVGITKLDRDRATQLQVLRKEAEANLRRQRIELGLPLSSSDAVFGEGAGYPPVLSAEGAYAAEQALQEEELELLAQARGLAYQQSKRLQLPHSAGGAADLPDLSSTNRRPKSHSPAIPLLPANSAQNVLQPSAPIHPQPHAHQQDSKMDLGADLQLPPAPSTVKKRRSANNAAAIIKQQTEESRATAALTDGMSRLGKERESQTGTPTQPNPRKRRSGAVPGSAVQSSSLLSTLTREDDPISAIPAGNIAQSAAVAGLSASVTSSTGGIGTSGGQIKDPVRPSRSRLMSSIGASSGGGGNQATPTSANHLLQQPSTSNLVDTALNPLSQASASNISFSNKDKDNSRMSSEDEHQTHLDHDEEDEDDTDIDERYEPWHFEYTPVSKLRYSSRDLQAKVQELVRRAVEEERENLVSGGGSVDHPNTENDLGKENNASSADSTAFAVPSLPSSAKSARPAFLSSTSSFLGSHLSLSSSTRNGSPGPSSGSSTPLYSSVGVASSLSCPITPVFLTSSTPLSSIQADLPRLSVKPLATSSLSLAPPACTPFSGPTSIVPSLMNPYPRPTIHGVFTTCSYPSGSLIAIMNGQIFDGKEYRADPINQWNELGVMKNHTRGIGLPWDIVLDQRKWGDESRFVRQGCHPNVFVRPLIVRKNREGGESSTSTSRKNYPNNKDAAGRKAINNSTASRKAINAMLQGGSITEGSSDEYELAFGLYSLQDISKREELVLPFDWSDDHVVHSLHTLLFEPGLVFPPDIPTHLNRSSGGAGLGNGNGTDTSDDNDNDPDAHDGGHGRSKSTNHPNTSTSAYSTLSQTQRQAINSATIHLYRLSKLANMVCLTLLGTTICACEKRRDCAIAWLWKLASFSEVNPKTRNNYNLLLSSETTNRLMDFDLKGLKIACSTALATEEKQGGAYNGTTRGSKKMGRKRRADLGALVGLVRGWNAFQRFNKREEEAGRQNERGDDDEQEEEVDMQEDDEDDEELEDVSGNGLAAENGDHEMQVDLDPSHHSLKRDHPTMILPPSSAMPDVPEEVDMLMPTPTSNNSRSRQRNEFDFTNSNIPPILQSLMHNHDPQIAHTRKDADMSKAEDQEEEEGRASDSDLTEPLPSDGEEGGMRTDAMEEEVVRPPKRRKSSDQGKSARSMPEEQPTGKKAKPGKKIGNGKNKQALEAGEEALRDKRRKKSKQSGQASDQPSASTSTGEVQLPKIIKKALKARKEQKEQADPEDPPAASAGPGSSTGPSLDSLFDMKIPSPPAQSAPQLPDPQVGAATSSSAPSDALKTAAVTGESEKALVSQLPSVDTSQASQLSSTATSTAAVQAPQAEKPALSQVRKLSFRDYKQRVSTAQPATAAAPKGPLAVSIPEEQAEASPPLTTAAKHSEASTPIVSPARSPDKMDIDAPVQIKESPEVPVKESELAKEEPAIIAPPKAPSPPPAPRARLSFKAYRERLSASGTSAALSPVTATKAPEQEPPTPKPAVPETIFEKPETITEEPASMVPKADEQLDVPVMPPPLPSFKKKEIVEAVVKPVVPEPKPEPISVEPIQKAPSQSKSPLKGEDSEEEGELVTDPVSEPGEVKSSHSVQDDEPQEKRTNTSTTTRSTWEARTPSPPPSTRDRARSPAPRHASPPFDNRYGSRDQRYGPPASPPQKASTGPFGSPPGRPVQLHRSTGPLSPQGAPSSLQSGTLPPTGPRNPVAPPPPAWSGRGRGGSLSSRGRGFGASTYRPGPPPSAPRADREGQPPPSAPRALRGGYQGPNTRGGYGGRGSSSSGPGRDAGWPSRGRRGRGSWQSDR